MAREYCALALDKNRPSWQGAWLVIGLELYFKIYITNQMMVGNERLCRVVAFPKASEYWVFDIYLSQPSSSPHGRDVIFKILEIPLRTRRLCCNAEIYCSAALFHIFMFGISRLAHSSILLPAKESDIRVFFFFFNNKRPLPDAQIDEI